MQPITFNVVELNKQMIEYGVNNMHVICGFKTAFASKRGIISILCGALKASFLLVTNRLTLVFSALLMIHQEDEKTS